MQANDDALRTIIRHERRNCIDSCKLYAQHLRNKFAGPGLSLCFANKGKRVLHEGFGYHSAENPVAAGRDFKGNIASISKPFTSHVIGRVEQEDENGLLEEDTWKYVKQLKGDSFNQVEVLPAPGEEPENEPGREEGGIEPKNRMEAWTDECKWPYRLLPSNLSGWEHYYDGVRLVYQEESWNLQNLFKKSEKEKLMTMLDYKKLQVEPGEFEYSNNGFNLAGLILSHIKNESFTGLATREILNIGLMNTNYDASHFKVPYGFFEPQLSGIASEKKQLEQAQQFSELLHREHDPKVKFDKNFSMPVHAKKQNRDFEAFNIGKVDFGYKQPSEGVTSTSGDLQKFLDVYASMYHGDVNGNFAGPLSRQNFRKMLMRTIDAGKRCNTTKSLTKGYGMGWQLQNDWMRTRGEGLRRVGVFGHDGMTEGFYSDARMFVTTNLRKDSTVEVERSEDGVVFKNEVVYEDGYVRSVKNYNCHTITGALMWGQQGNGTNVNNVSEANPVMEIWRMIHSAYGE